MIIKRELIVCAILAIAAGCSSLLEPRPDHSRFFILTPISDGMPPATASGSTADSQITLGIGPIDFPKYLSRSQVVTRTTSNEIHVSEEQRWGEPLDQNFRRVLSQNLAHLLNTPRIEQYPWSRKLEVDYQITIVIERFEVDSDAQAKLLALWIVHNARTHEILLSSQTAANAAAGNDPGQGSAALSADLAALSRDIAAYVGSLPKTHETATAAADTGSRAVAK